MCEVIKFDGAKRQVKAILLLERILNDETDGKRFDRLSDVQVLVAEALAWELDHMGGLLGFDAEERERILFEGNELLTDEQRAMQVYDLFETF